MRVLHLPIGFTWRTQSWVGAELIAMTSRQRFGNAPSYDRAGKTLPAAGRDEENASLNLFSIQAENAQ